MARIIGLDVHRTFAEMAIYEHGRVRHAGRMTKQQDYAWARPSLTEQKRRKLELRAGQAAHRGQRGRAHAYNLKTLRVRARAIGEQADRAYQTLVAHWRPQPRKRGPGAANAARR
jgi:hypothetical protein